MKSLLLAALGVMWFASAGRAAVFSVTSTGQLRRWSLLTNNAYVSTNVVNTQTHAVRFFLASDGYSRTNTAAELNAVRAAFGVWQATPGTILKFEDGGLVAPLTDWDYQNGTNVVFWAKTSTWVAGQSISGVVGLTIYANTSDGVMVGAAIVLNGINYSWFTDPNATSLGGLSRFVEAIVTHELGHFVGLEHSPLGGATMFYRDFGGVGPYVGLATDEILAAQFLYPESGLLASRGRIEGRITLSSTNVLGAMVVAENSAGNIASATLSQADGTYYLPALPPGSYLLRVCPLDPLLGGVFLTRGVDIAQPDYTAAVTAFLPSTNPPVLLSAGQTKSLNFALAGGNPPFRIVGIRPPSLDPTTHPFPVNSTASLRVGQSNYIVGVYSQDSITGATLAITGDGLTTTPLGITNVSGYNLLFAAVSVSSNATPGLRSFVLTRGGNLAYANGFFEVQPAQPDYNFDGLDDNFQRRYFSLWTAPEAGPKADPDGDGFNNAYEYLAGSNPTDRNSVPAVELECVKLTTGGSLLTWNSVPGAKYQIWRRSVLSTTDPWQQVRTAMTATNWTAQFLDASATNRIEFYRVQLLPGL